jgi:hypothetical protein
MRVLPAKTKSDQGAIARIKKIVCGSSKSSMDSRQKKAALLVGVLCVVFAGVLVVSLGGLGHSNAKAAAQKNAPSANPSSAVSGINLCF